MNTPLDGKALVRLLDELRSAYELARQSGPRELQRRLLSTRRGVLALVHSHLLLQNEMLRLREAITRHDEFARAAQLAAEEALFTTRREDQGPHKPS
ncbi:MAG TPA: hypothetical protein VME21_08410 [Steroidobacteraceae bacterium]|nr:hypothetical protein [Steroidobacteraceae bacterium]